MNRRWGSFYGRSAMSSSDLRPIAAAVVSTGRVERPRPLAGESPPARPFVTVSRQAGAGGPAFGHALARRLRELDHGGRPWEAIDRELVERVVGEHHVPASLVRDFEDRSRTWLADLVEGLQFASNEPGELAVFHRVAHTIATFAREGRVVIIGRGS